MKMIIRMFENVALLTYKNCMENYQISHSGGTGVKLSRMR